MINGIDKVVKSNNWVILDAMTKCDDVLRQHKRALVSISGGGDSDVMLDLVERVKDGTGCDVSYVWFDTGLEYQATKDHLDYLEDRYGIEILRYRGDKTIPQCAREFGQPFLSKYVSEHISRLQAVGFDWADEPLEELVKRYPTRIAPLKWWCNRHTRIPGKPGRFDIGRNKWLKEFMVENPPTFKISNKCCTYTKKKVGNQADRDLGIDLKLIGLRKSEGGIRQKLNVCYTHHDDVSIYYPLLWFNNDDKAEYDRMFGIRHSDCYEVWGFKRTGCVGCPFARSVEEQLDVSSLFEPKLVNAVRYVFKDSYEYTMAYRQFVARRKDETNDLSLRYQRRLDI